MIKRVWMGKKNGWMDVNLEDCPNEEEELVRYEHGDGGYGYIAKNNFPPAEERKGFLALTVAEDQAAVDQADVDQANDQAADEVDELVVDQGDVDDLANDLAMIGQLREYYRNHFTNGYRDESFLLWLEGIINKNDDLSPTASDRKAVRVLRSYYRKHFKQGRSDELFLLWVEFKLEDYDYERAAA